MENNLDQSKRVQDSYTEQVQVVTYACLNGNSRLFGGRLLQWIDEVAGVCAMRHSGRTVTTAQVEKLQFLGPAYLGELIVLKAHVTYVGNTSMEICVRSFVEELNGTQKLINQAYLVIVALDEEERPVRVPRLIIESPEQQREWDEAQRRRTSR